MRLTKRWTEPVPVDIAPLIDIVFQQLIYFMLTSSFIANPGIRVALPKAASSQRISASNLVITLTKDHVIYWEDQVVTLREVRERLKRLGPDRTVLIRADRYAYVDKLIQLWDLCREGGIEQVHIATLPE